ncbi:MAG: N-acetyltransferase family protein [Gammaproteobacteria bacterium]
MKRNSAAAVARVRVRPVEPQMADAWLQMRHALWPEGSLRQHRKEIAAYFAGGALDPLAVLVALDAGGSPLGFVELTLRSHAEGCEPGSIAYLEGWYVRPGLRGQGVGRKLVAAAERWARERGCSEFASDAWSSNRTSRKAHLALGFQEMGVIRCFRKKLGRR